MENKILHLKTVINVRHILFGRYVPFFVVGIFKTKRDDIVPIFLFKTLWLFPRRYFALSYLERAYSKHRNFSFFLFFSFFRFGLQIGSAFDYIKLGFFLIFSDRENRPKSRKNKKSKEKVQSSFAKHGLPL